MYDIKCQLFYLLCWMLLQKLPQKLPLNKCKYYLIRGKKRNIAMTKKKNNNRAKLSTLDI